MQYLIFRNNFKNTLRTFSSSFCRNHPTYKNAISLNPQNTCSFTRVVPVDSLQRDSLKFNKSYLGGEGGGANVLFLDKHRNTDSSERVT